MERGRHGPSLMDVAIPFLRWGVITEFAALGRLSMFLLAVWVWKMPFGDGLRAYLYGSATGIWAVGWITVWGVILFNTLVTSLADPLASTQVLSPLAPQ